MADARKIALLALLKVTQEGGYSNLVLDNLLEDSELDSRDRAFASALLYGTLERHVTINFIISKYSKTPVRKLSPIVREAIALALYQIFYMDKVPESAAVDQSVRLVKNSKDSRLSGYVNAVLRSVLRDGREKAFAFKDGATRLKKLSINYSVPEWLVTHLEKSYSGKLCEGVLASSFGRPPLTVKVNTTKISAEDLINSFVESGIEARENPLCRDSLFISSQGSIEQLEQYKQGFFHVQDSASTLACMALSPKPGERVLDLCAAPGGKSFTLAEFSEDKGEVLSLDLHDNKLSLISNGAKRLGLASVKTGVNDARKYNPDLGEFDKVLCDLPCSGLGVIRRKPEIRYKNNSVIDSFADLQYSILCESVKYLKAGGILVFSTCTLNPAENGKNADRLLAENAFLQPLEIFSDKKRAIKEPSNQLTLFPQLHNTDGFFISAFRKVTESEN